MPDPNRYLSDIRRRAWITRRKKYGKRGHAGTYSRGTNDGLLNLALRLLNEGVLSEGQVAKAANMDRVQVRQALLAWKRGQG